MAVCGSSKLLLSGRVRPCEALCACIQSPARLVYVKKGHRRTWPRHRHVYPTHQPTRHHSLLFSCPSLWRRRDLVVHTPLNCQSCQSHSYHRALSQSRGGGRGLHTTACVCLLVARPSKHLVTREDARVWVSSLTPSERNNLEWALQEVEPSETDAEAPSWNQLRLLCYQSALPFVGFGFLDNFIMIAAGEYIDWTIGVSLGISTMAAAGLGNLISDLAGLGLAHQVEVLYRSLGIPDPHLSPSQRAHRSSKWTGLLGRCVGVIIGCLIGMAPLLWFDRPNKHGSSAEEIQSGCHSNK